MQFTIYGGLSLEFSAHAARAAPAHAPTVVTPIFRNLVAIFNYLIVYGLKMKQKKVNVRFSVGRENIANRSQALLH